MHLLCSYSQLINNPKELMFPYSPPTPLWAGLTVTMKVFTDWSQEQQPTAKPE